ncbi:MAG: hypothetical protein H0X64_08930 [Gemmatimonadaceae bacterium]|nr:hypothetical protein [Gemmatimonadaceae bacterium]
MSHWKRAFPSKYLQTADLDAGPITATIDRVTMEEISEGEPSKLVVHFRETGVKALVINLTRGEAIAEIAGDEDTDKWVGAVIQLVKGSTRYQGRKVGCITVQAPLDADAVGF